MQVQVIDGPCKGQQGTVLAVVRKKKRVVVEGVNMVRERACAGVCMCVRAVTWRPPTLVHLRNSG